jgi:hypothetical protein
MRLSSSELELLNAVNGNNLLVAEISAQVTTLYQQGLVKCGPAQGDFGPPYVISLTEEGRTAYGGTNDSSA